ncbi:MAG: Methionyl-tRNA formyltransferase [Patescibacteria group bacterium]|nr:Methionyl-tRNA formyltransferase [Patescibacteria group bacterium]
MDNKNIKFVFFGSGPLAESALYSLYQNNLIPSLVVTSPDKKAGRNLELHKNVISLWCESKNINFWQPGTLKNLDINSSPLGKEKFDVGIIVSYPKILKKDILALPASGCLNIHPSLLPKYRGPSPIQTALLNGDENIGISIMKLDEEVDHGPILIQTEMEILDEDTNETVERKAGAFGGDMLAQILSHYIDGSLKLADQDHSKATTTRKFEKKEGEIKLEDDADVVQNKFKALLPHIPIFFFIKHKDKEIRVKINEIELNKDLAKNKSASEIIKKVTPEGKSEMSFSDFEKGYLK